MYNTIIWGRDYSARPIRRERFGAAVSALGLFGATVPALTPFGAGLFRRRAIRRRYDSAQGSFGAG